MEDTLIRGTLVQDFLAPPFDRVAHCVLLVIVDKGAVLTGILERTRGVWTMLEMIPCMKWQSCVGHLPWSRRTA